LPSVVAGLEFERVERECECGEVDGGDGRARYISPSTDIGSLGLVDEGRIVGRVVIFFRSWSDRRHVDGRSIGQDPGDGKECIGKDPGVARRVKMRTGIEVKGRRQ